MVLIACLPLLSMQLSLHGFFTGLEPLGSLVLQVKKEPGKGGCAQDPACAGSHVLWLGGILSTDDFPA